MTAIVTIPIGIAHLANDNPRDRTRLYLSFIVAVARAASELRFQTDSEFGDVFYRTGGVDHQIEPVPPYAPMKELRSRLPEKLIKQLLQKQAMSLRFDFDGVPVDSIVRVDGPKVLFQLDISESAIAAARSLLGKYIDYCDTANGSISADSSPFRDGFQIMGVNWMEVHLANLRSVCLCTGYTYIDDLSIVETRGDPTVTWATVEVSGSVRNLRNDSIAVCLMIIGKDDAHEILWACSWTDSLGPAIEPIRFVQAVLLEPELLGMTKWVTIRMYGGKDSRVNS